MMSCFSRWRLPAALCAILIVGAGVMTPMAGQRPGTPAVDDADQPIRTQARNPDGVAVVIGIRDYQSRDVPKVEFAVNDAEAISRVLTQTLGYPQARVLLRKNEEVSASKLRLLVRQDLRSRVKPGQSDVFFYFCSIRSWRSRGFTFRAT